ncbi:MAG: HEAT repeat domain-containing protein, partial [bacterium]|nr:HEAT repeat domain-containing protein [bacterium]
QDFSLGIPVYKMPVIISITTSNKKITKKVWIQNKEEMFEFSVNEKPLLVRFDEGNYLLKEWTFEKSSDELRYQLNKDDVIGRMWAASELTKHENSPDVIEELSNSALNDPFWAVRREALEAMNKLNTEMQNDLLKRFCKDGNSKVRTSVLQILGDKKDPEMTSFFKEQFEKEDSYSAQAEALRSIGKSGDRSKLSFLRNASKMSSPRDVIKRAAEWAINELNKDR